MLHSKTFSRGKTYIQINCTDFGNPDFYTSIAQQIILRSENVWNVQLTEEEKERVIFYALRQTEEKIESTARIGWVFGDSMLPIHVSSSSFSPGVYQSGINETIKIKNGSRIVSVHPLPHSILLTRVNNFWHEANPHDETIEKYSVEEVVDFYKRESKQWFRTAVHYGVGSYKGA